MTQTFGFRLFQIARSDMEGVTEIILVTEQRTPGIKASPKRIGEPSDRRVAAKGAYLCYRFQMLRDDALSF